jgi:hypothetical protein
MVLPLVLSYGHYHKYQKGYEEQKWENENH